MAAIGSASTSADSWDHPTFSDPQSSATYISRRKVPTQHVPDDWDNDDDDDEPENSKVWDDANKNEPMPDLIISPSSTGQPLVSPPLSVFQSPMRILKRPSPVSGSSITSNSSQDSYSSRHTLAEREAQYKAARDRIFGGSTQAGDGGIVADFDGSEHLDDGKAKRNGSKAEKETSITVVRNPLGPSDADSSNVADKITSAKGFGGRRSGKKPESTFAALG
ncbi:hypothetical protein SERLA73DRAFT_191526 [Serpula lacrymans var. lacrymans S7.3]|uniref:SUZ domain-containing protein n=2 Tax=Serpula lacrymans var. lacrymans TaxID=341189 RepID=F8QHR6_SERL3|nr:uncharacterized protein SERLADRAFT_414588 [Serpula lacrymans var. lacrymans S7.9]EGN92178.1 hypothetical protein SERLA73DRAFT_191526 [Serpula lacrymans var. lacrymans S7.3]EGO26639.1 hypothetical protein SERLADRAFT_414588 [Serpula lacrymans var. lacrymans S7.9]